MRRDALLAFLRTQKLCVQASVSPSGAPQAAVVGFAVTDDLEFVFDTLGSTRKMANLRREPRISLVIGSETSDEQTVQIDGIADEPQGAELARLTEVYLRRFPDGLERQNWNGLTYVCVRPTWLRYSDFRLGTNRVVEIDQVGLDKLKTAERAERR